MTAKRALELVKAGRILTAREVEQALLDAHAVGYLEGWSKRHKWDKGA